MKALIFEEFGAPSVLQYCELPDPVAGRGEVLVQMKAIGLNYADIYRRQGNYHFTSTSPHIAGYEGAGIVIQADRDSGFQPGDAVGFADVPRANATRVKAPASHLIPLPTGIDCTTAAAVLLQGLTAQYLAEDSHQVQAGETIVIHAAAGGVGQLLTQMALLKGAVVIGLTSSADKRRVILQNGATHAFLLQEHWVEQVLQATGGKGADVVYDSIGSTLLESIRATRTGGRTVFFGFSGGRRPVIDAKRLMDSSKTLTGGHLWNYLTSREERLQRAERLFNWILTGQLRLPQVTCFQLHEGGAAHEYLETQKSTGKILLLPAE